MLIRQLIVLVLLYILLYIPSRNLLTTAKKLLVGHSSHRHRRKAFNPWEWLTFASVCDCLPRRLLFMYWYVTLAHPIAIVACIFMEKTGGVQTGEIIMYGILGLDVLTGLIQFLFFPVHADGGRKFRMWLERWKYRKKHK